MPLILQEHRSYDQSEMATFLKEDKDRPGKNSMYMKGIFIQAETRNQNGRIYPLEEIRNAVNTINSKIKAGNSVYGELDHPDTLTINLDRVACMITEMHMEGNNGMGTLKILPTPMGNIARALLENGGKLGVSSRGTGDLDSFNNVKDYEIVTVDIVANPSCRSAMPQSFKETIETSSNGKEMIHLASQSDDLAQKYLKEEVLKFLGNITL